MYSYSEDPVAVLLSMKRRRRSLIFSPGLERKRQPWDYVNLMLSTL